MAGFEQGEFDEACRRGESIDALLWDGDPAEAEARHHAVLDDMYAHGHVDAYLAAKHTLGLLYALIGQKRHVDAHAVWLGREPVVAKVGILAIESGQTSTRDLACYFIVSAYLASLDTDHEEGYRRMKGWSMRVIDMASAPGDVELCSFALSNWRLHLREIYENDVPDNAVREVMVVARRTGLDGDFLGEKLGLPRLSPWRVDWTDPGNRVVVQPGGPPLRMSPKPEPSTTAGREADRSQFVSLMKVCTGFLRSGEPEQALRLLTVFDETLTEQLDPQDYGWMFFYRFEAAFQSGDHAQALRLAENGPKRFEAAMTLSNAARMYSVAAESAAALGYPDKVIAMIHQCIKSRRLAEDNQGVLMAASTGCALLHRLGRQDLNHVFVKILLAQPEASEEHRAAGYFHLCLNIHRTGDPDRIKQLHDGLPWLRTCDNDLARDAVRFAEAYPRLAP